MGVERTDGLLKGESLKALELYNLAAKIEPENAQVHYNMAVLFWKQQKWNEVVSEFSKVLNIDPNNKDAAQYLEVAKKKIN